MLAQTNKGFDGSIKALQRTATRPGTSNDFMKLQPQLSAQRQPPVAVALSFEYEEVFPNGLPIAADGCGNFWVLDITPQTTLAAPVFFACHDAPVILYQSADIASFLAEAFRMMTPPHDSLVNDVLGDRLFRVWRRNPSVMDQAVAANSSDAELRSFASGLPEHFQIVDLRSVSPGMGFSWGRYGPRTEVRRHGYERIFGYAKPPRTGLLSKLFGG